MITEEHKEGENLSYKIKFDTTNFASWTDTEEVSVELDLKVFGKDRKFKGVIKNE